MYQIVIFKKLDFGQFWGIHSPKKPSEVANKVFQMVNISNSFK